MIEEKNINPSLETNLALRSFSELREKLNLDNITINYNVGSSVKFDFNSVEKQKMYIKNLYQKFNIAISLFKI
jgi:hypothetical protein